MKTYSIGRDLNCDIVINDSTDVISRRHALLNITPSGKMTIIDQSSNGTYVNGIKISPNVPVPVTRKDTISLAHVAKLDWALVPDEGRSMKYAIGGAAGILLLACAAFGINHFVNQPETPQPSSSTITATDSLDQKTKKLAEDSIKKAKEDSIKKTVKDSIDKAQKRPSATTPTQEKRSRKNPDSQPQKETPKPKPQTPKRVAG